MQIVIAASAVLVLFLVKNWPNFQNTTSEGLDQSGLTYKTEALGDLVNKDSDNDTIPDWEENLWGTDPTKKETTQGIPDSTAIANLKNNSGDTVGAGNSTILTPDDTNLTETDKFSRDFFATVSTLNQTGSVDDNTADQIGSALADKIQNTAQRKVFTLADVKTINQTVKNTKDYDTSMGKIYAKYPIEDGSVTTILQNAMNENGDLDSSKLTKLDPVVTNTKGILDTISKISVPADLALLHLNVLNGEEKMFENLSDVKKADSDPIVALSAFSQLEQNNDNLSRALVQLNTAIQEKLNN